MSICEMGFHWAKLLKSHGVEVFTYDKDRGEVSRKRAENAGVKSLPSMAALVSEAELIVSIVVPFAARRVATKVAKAAMKAGRKDLLYLDANAISPMTADNIAKTLIPAGMNFVDGCIIGARRFGLLNEIRAQYEESFPGLLAKVSSSIVGLRIHAGRRAEEMDDLKRTFNHHGMKSYMAPAVQKVLEAIAELNVGQASDDGARAGELMETLEFFYQKWLLRSASKSVEPSSEALVNAHNS